MDPVVTFCAKYLRSYDKVKVLNMQAGRRLDSEPIPNVVDPHSLTNSMTHCANIGRYGA